MTFIYKLDPYARKTYRMSENELRTAMLVKAIVRQTDRQTDTTEIITTAASRVVINIMHIIYHNETPSGDSD